MDKKNSNPNGELAPTQIEELVEFVYNFRKQCGNAWWVGWSDKLDDPEEPMLEKIRGFYINETDWRMFREERCDNCANIPADNAKILAHGQTKNHIRKMLAKQDPKQLRTDYDHMLEVLADSVQRLGQAQGS